MVEDDDYDTIEAEMRLLFFLLNEAHKKTSDGKKTKQMLREEIIGEPIKIFEIT